MYSSSDDEEEETPVLGTLDISNDQYYQTLPGFKLKSINLNYDNRESAFEQILLELPQYGSNTIKHSLPAYDLWRPFFPAYLSEEKFRNFHRPKLRHYNTGPQAKCYLKKSKPIPIKNLTRFICHKQKKLRFNIIKAINMGLSREEIIEKHLLIRYSKDLTAKCGELFLFEYSEEYPPVLSQNGMAANIFTITQQASPTLQHIYKSIKNKIANRSLTQNTNNIISPLNVSNSSNINVSIIQQSSPDSNAIKTSKHVGNYKIGIDKTINNKNTTKQIYYNPLKSGSKLQVIENNLYRAPIYTHEMPSCDFLVIRTRNNIYIRSIKTIFTVGQTMPLVTIPEPTDNSINKFRAALSNIYIHKFFMESDDEPASLDFNHLLKLFPDYSRSNMYKRMTRKGVTYDKDAQICYIGSSNYDKIPLKELRTSFTPEQYCLNMAMLAARQRLRELNYTESMILPPTNAELETEVLAAPWNTSRAVLRALTGKNYLNLKDHLIDPTGQQREGFSCVAWSKSPTEDQQAKEQLADKSNLEHDKTKNQAVQMKNPMSDKIRREKLERLAIYNREAQLVSEVQTKVLSSRDELSSDESSEDNNDEDPDDELNASTDQQLRDLDRILTAGKTLTELSYEKEEEERKQMMKEFNVNGNKTNRTSSPIKDDPINVGTFKNKILKITRTYESDEGFIKRAEIVRDPRIIALYVKHKLKHANPGNESTEANNNNTAIDVDMETSINVRQNLNHTIATSSVSGAHNLHNKEFQKRRSSISLCPTELCRTDGMVLTISKRVLDSRFMRNQKRLARASQS